MLPLHNGGSQASQQQVERDSGVAHEMREAGEQMREVAGFGEAPPKYEEVVPIQHQKLAGGMAHEGAGEDGIVADGKTPLSEMTFEDVVVGDHTMSQGESSTSASRRFMAVHHNGMGDMSGHTNS